MLGCAAVRTCKLPQLEYNPGVQLLNFLTTLVVQLPKIIIDDHVLLLPFRLFLLIGTDHHAACRSFCRAGMTEFLFRCHKHVRYLCFLAQDR